MHRMLHIRNAYLPISCVAIIVLTLLMACHLSACQSNYKPIAESAIAPPLGKVIEEYKLHDPVSLVQKATAEYYFGGTDLFGVDGSNIPVILTTGTDDLWAFAYCDESGLPGQNHSLVFRIKGTTEKPEPLFMFNCLSAISPAIAVNIYEYNSKYLVVVGITDYHWNSLTGEHIDISKRSYMVITGNGEKQTVPADGVGYICVLDYVPTNMVIYDSFNNILFQLSDWNDFLFNYVDLSS